jgi:hypothetical protein
MFLAFCSLALSLFIATVHVRNFYTTSLLGLGGSREVLV